MNDDLAALRKAARERDPNQAQFLLKRIFLNVPFYRALAVAIERAYQHVDTFERYHPDAKWARQALVQITSLGTAPGELPPEAMRSSLAWRRTSSRRSSTWRTQRGGRQIEARVGYLVSAVVNAIMAELVECWYGSVLMSERMRQNRIDPATGQYHDPEANQIAYRFWMDAEMARRDTEAWLAVADSVEEKLRR
jgi:hypothetical protein